MAASMVSDQTGAAFRTEFTLPALAQVHRRLSELVEDPRPIMRWLVRVFIDDGTFCPGFQFLPGGQLHPTVTLLLRRAMELKLPHNYFTVWMVTRSRDLAGARPVDRLNAATTPLVNALESFHWQ